MNKEEKKKYLDKITSDKSFIEALEKVNSESEREKIKTLAADVFFNVLDGFIAIQKLVKENPEKVAEAAAKHIPKK